MSEVRTLPLRLPVADGESFDSWLEALARDYRTTPRVMMGLLGVDGAQQAVNTLAGRTGRAQWRRAEAAAGLTPGRLVLAADLGGAVALRGGGSRYCPKCLAASGGRWPAAWRSNWAVACLPHRTLLLESCPACRRPPRVRPAGGDAPVPAATCPLLVGTPARRCGADFTAPAASPAPEFALDVQRWLDELSRRNDEAAFADLLIVVGWLQRYLLRADPLPPGRRQRSLQAMDTATTARVLTRAKTMLAGGDETAIGAMRELIDQFGATKRLTPPGLSHWNWTRLSPLVVNRYLRAADEDMNTADRLRHRSPVASAAIPTNTGTERDRFIPQLIWPDVAARLLPPTGHHPERFRAVMSICLLAPGRAGSTFSQLAGVLSPHLSGPQVLIAHQALDGPMLTDTLRYLCRIADHLDAEGAPIDYRRRREQITPDDIISWPQWRNLACSVSAHPGDVRGNRHLHVRRHLHQLLTGADLDDRRHPLVFHDPAERSRYFAYVNTLSVKLRAALHRHAADRLAELGIDEPVTWSPPPELADGLFLPGVDIAGLDLDRIRTVVVDDKRPARDAAAELGVHLDHIRMALERIDRPEPEWKAQSAPTAWAREQQASKILTREYFDREYTDSGRTLTQIAQATGFNRAQVARQAHRHGITVDQAIPRTTRIDPVWLREQYVKRRRSSADIAAEIDTSQMTVNRALERCNIPIRASGVASHPHMVVTLDKRLPADLRAAVEGGLHGWARLNRFHIAMAFPSLNTAAAYLGAHPNALVTQFQRLEADIGGSLFERGALGRPHRPTPRGKRLLDVLGRSHVQALMRNALGTDMRAVPGPEVLEQAATHNRRPRKPPTPSPLPALFQEISAERIRLHPTTIRVLRWVLDHGQEFYGMDITAELAVNAGTLYPMLRRLEQAGWLASRPEDEAEWLAGSPPGRGPGRRRIYYALTDGGRRAALYELEHHAARRPRKAQEP